MVAYKFVLMALGLFALTATTSAALVSPGSSMVAGLRKRDCGADCEGALADCPDRCQRSGVNKEFFPICHDGQCYCGFSSEG